jgi:hypothetical protein
MHDKPKPLTGWQRRKVRVENGLPRYTPGEAASRKARDARRGQERTRENVQYVTELKMKFGCVDCGYKGHPAALDFDHLPGHTKRRGISRMVQAHRNTLLAEIAKCEVVCANCHRIRTWRRG